jgi:O-antigen/teichoic acid export membrane protein
VLARLASPALAAYALKGANALAAFAATAMLARAAGPAVIGDYGFAVLTGTLLSMLALRGLDLVSLRVVAGDLRMEDSAAARGTTRYVARTVLAASLLLTSTFAALAAAAPLAEWLAVDRMALIAGSLGIAATAFFRLGLSFIRAIGRPVAGQFYEGLHSFLFAAVVGAFWLSGRVPTAAGAVVAYFSCQFITIVILWALITRAARSWAPAAPPNRETLTKAGLPIMFARGMDIFSDWFLLALIAGAASTTEVGAMRVAMQVVMIMFMIVATGENFLAAKVAGDIRAGRPDLVWARHRRATLLMAAVLGPIVLACMVAPGPLMSVAFGPAFVIAAPALAVMAAGQGTKVITGPIGSLLSMGGFEKPILAIAVGALAITMVLAFVLTPLWGLVGAAAAHAAGYAFRNIASHFTARYFISR